MSIRFRVIILALIGLVAVSVTAYWFHVAGQMRKGIESFAAQRRAEGWTVQMDEPVLGGFPRAVTARLDSLSLRSPAGLSWKADGVTITLPLADPLHVTVEAPGFHRLSGFDWSGIISAQTATARLRLTTEGKLSAVTVDAATLVLEQPGVDPLSAASLALTAERLTPPESGHDKPSLAATLSLRGLDLPELTNLPLARRLETVQVEARLLGAPPDAAPLAALAAWSADGGTVELDRITVEWAPLTLEANGTLALDSALQPLIATTARIRGWGELVTRLVQVRLIDPGMAEAAKIMMAILARPDSQGRPTLTVPLTLQDGVLTAGQVRIAQVPPLPVPAPTPGAPP
ncbi:hypothetical protein CU669_02560 [Paramagnetospirillum kuznetsovii]|uniref:DUF2125 domain-containing protein n=1 Tax=Paramagnetospirillum kuznetsovii TaxID=2053833 RepID=A0A364P3P7_9PROT|nr:DUF2125 domain-containing protein [Paramagnetospirillum kuznetsovii]RAU23968.1 hypothetical protein CU669_02560 [Paramagnetospirillum kuznetsovii]